MLKGMKYAALILTGMFAVSCSHDVSSVIEKQKEKLLQETELVKTELHLYVKKEAAIDKVPFIQQMPELQRGCEVTSLAMLLQYGGANVDKMTLAREITHVPFKTGSQHGNPNEGFVGDIYTFAEPGYGVYHKPIYKLAQRYVPGKVVDLTGRDIEDIYKMIGLGSPVWVVTTSTFQPLPESEFETWQTSDGDIQITYSEHSVVIVGYDESNVYVNDPLDNGPRTAHPRKQFEQAWVQMGKQAISLLPN